MLFLRQATALFAPLLLLPLGSLAAQNPADYLVYIGTYTNGKSKGIYAYRFSTKTGKLTSIGLVAETPNPTFIALDPSQRFLYAANELEEYKGEKAGAVSSFAIDRKTGALTALNTVSARGPGTCHLIVDKKDKTLVAANYTGGSTAAYPVHPDGRLGEASSFIQHTGLSTNPRQGGPHAHCATVSPDNRFVFVADLGLDKVLSYRLNDANSTLTPNDPASASVDPGSGPRHFIFAPNGKYAYVINEIASSITAFTYDAGRGALQSIQTISTLPADFKGENSTAEIEAHPNGKFIYGSNRGHNSIAIFAVDPAKGTLTSKGTVSTQGKTPRNFAIDPSGTFMFAANQDSDSVIVFRLDPKTGQLTPTGEKVDVGSPVCIKFVPAG